MNEKKRGLGRSLGDLGLSELLKKINTNVPPGESNANLSELPLSKIKPGRYQPRKNIAMDTLEELAQSIREQGLIQPIIVKPLDAENYEIIAGERRWRAVQLLGWEKIPALIREIPDQSAMAISLIENIQRENLNPIEEAQALRRLVDEFQLTHDQVAQSVGKSRSVISNLLRILNLHPQIQTWMQQGQIEMGHAKVLLALEGEKQLEIATLVVNGKLTVRETEQLVYKPNSTKKIPSTTLNPAKNPNLEKLAEAFTQKMQKRVVIKHSPSGRGKLVVYYKKLEELESLLTRI